MAIYPDKRHPQSTAYRADAATDAILGRSGILQGVEPPAISSLTGQLEAIGFRKGKRVFDEGEPGDRLYIIISGKLKICRRSPDGREIY